MSKELEITRVRKTNELEKLAMQFHQDFDLDINDFDGCVDQHIRILSLDRVKLLNKELLELLAVVGSESDARKMWKAAGAEWIPKNINLIDKLNNIASILGNISQ